MLFGPVRCASCASLPGENTGQASGQDGEPLPAYAMSLEPLTSPTTQDVDVSYVFDAEPEWDGMTAPPV